MLEGTLGVDKLSATGTKDATTFLRGDNTFAAIAAGVDGVDGVDGADGTSAPTNANAPAFHAYSASTTSTAHNTATILKMDTEDYDTDGNYDASTYRFTPTTSGRFFVYMSAAYGNTNDFDHVRVIIRKNGNDVAVASTRQEGNTVLNCSTVTHMNGSSDYLEVFAYQAAGGTENFSSGEHQTFFGAYKLLL